MNKTSGGNTARNNKNNNPNEKEETTMRYKLRDVASVIRSKNSVLRTHLRRDLPGAETYEKVKTLVSSTRRCSPSCAASPKAT